MTFRQLLEMTREWLRSIGFSVCWRLLTLTNAKPIWFVWLLLRGELWDASTWLHAGRIAESVAWAETLDAMRERAATNRRHREDIATWPPQQLPPDV